MQDPRDVTDRIVAKDHSGSSLRPVSLSEQEHWQGSKELSPAQIPIWHAETLRRGTPRWTQLGVTTLDGGIDQHRLEHALRATVAHYPALRTCIVRQGREARQTLHDASGFAVNRHDFSGLPEEIRKRRVAEFIADAERHRFRLYSGWLFRADILVCAPDRSILLLLLHHIAADGVTFPLILRHAASVYRGEAATARADVAYERWLDRQTRRDPDPALDTALDFYQAELTGAPDWNERLYDREAATPLHEPPDLPRSTCVLEAAVVQGLSRLAERTASTLFIVLLAAYGMALRQALDAPDLVIGVFVSGRGGEAGLVAMAVNMVLVRLRLDDLADTAALVGRAKQAWRPVRRLEAAPIHALRQLAQRRATAEGDATPAEAPPGHGRIPDRVQISINFLDMRNTVFDVPGIVSHTTHPQSAFPLNDLMLVMFREHDDMLQLRLINGSGTPRLSSERLKVLLDILIDILCAWSTSATEV